MYRADHHCALSATIVLEYTFVYSHDLYWYSVDIILETAQKRRSIAASLWLIWPIGMLLVLLTMSRLPASEREVSRLLLLNPTRAVISTVNSWYQVCVVARRMFGFLVCLR